MVTGGKARVVVREFAAQHQVQMYHNSRNIQSLKPNSFNQMSLNQGDIPIIKNLLLSNVPRDIVL